MLVQLFADAAIWVSQFLYLSCFFPQIMTNFRERSTHGLSDLFLFGYFNAYVAYMYYVFCLSLPFGFKVMTIAQMTALTILILQRMYYTSAYGMPHFKQIFLANTALFLGVFPFAMNNPQFVGDMGGWALVTIFSVTPLPQIFKVFREKSVSGFNIKFILLLLAAASLEVFVALVLNLPLQTLLCAAKSFVVYGIIIFQFWLYRA